eukprot:COSAG02_NODE_4313_length_5521_cov_6.383991_2_plen_98_part_00
MHGVYQQYNTSSNSDRSKGARVGRHLPTARACTRLIKETSSACRHSSYHLHVCVWLHLHRRLQLRLPSCSVNCRLKRLNNFVHFFLRASQLLGERGA